jgi:nitrate reductase NapAB chaperone NapD
MFNSVTNITYNKLLTSCLDVFNSTLEKSFKTSIDKVLQDLFYQAEFAKTNQQELELFEQYNQLNKGQGQLIVYLQNAMQRMPIEFTEQIQVTDNVFNMSLVDDSELEISLELNQIESSISSRYIKQLYVLEKRINVLLKSKNISKNNIPMGANSICWILKTTINESQFSLSTKSSLLKGIKSELKYNLKEVYQQINDIFVEAKILPNIEFKPNRNKKTPKPKPQEKDSSSNKTSEDKAQSQSQSQTQNQNAKADTGHQVVNSIFDLMNQNKPNIDAQSCSFDNKV